MTMGQLKFTPAQGQRAFEEMERDQQSYVRLTDTLSEVGLFVANRCVPERHTASEAPEDIAIVETTREAVQSFYRTLIADHFHEAMELACDTARTSRRALYLRTLYSPEDNVEVGSPVSGPRTGE